MKTHKILTRSAHSDNLFSFFYRSSDWVKILRELKKFIFKQMLTFQLCILKNKKVSFLKSMISVLVSKEVKIVPTDGVCFNNFQQQFLLTLFRITTLPFFVKTDRNRHFLIRLKVNNYQSISNIRRIRLFCDVTAVLKECCQTRCFKI